MTTSPDRAQPGSHAGAVATALLVTALWSSSWVLIRIGLDDEELAPVAFAGLRYALAALVLVAYVLARPATRRSMPVVRGHVGPLVVLGVVFYALTQGAQYVAIDRQPAATTSLVLSLTPLVVAVVAGRTLGETATRRQVGGAVLVAAGAALFFAGGLGATAVGLSAATVGLAANAASAVLGRRVNRETALAAVVVTAVSMAVGAFVLVTVGVAIEGWPRLSSRVVVMVVWLAVVNTAVANTLWNRSLRRLDAIESAGINNTMLVQIAALGWIFLDEAPSALGLVGILTVSIGVYLTQTVAVLATPGRPSAARLSR